MRRLMCDGARRRRGKSFLRETLGMAGSFGISRPGLFLAYSTLFLVVLQRIFRETSRAAGDGRGRPRGLQSSRTYDAPADCWSGWRAQIDAAIAGMDSL